MKNIVILIKNNLKRAILIKPFNFIISLLGPFLILIIVMKINLVGGGHIKVGLIEEDKSKSSINIVEELRKYEGFTLIEIEEEYIDELFSNKDIDIVVKFKKGFEESILIDGKEKFIDTYSIEDSGELDIVKNVIDNETRSFFEISQSSKDNKESYYSSLKDYSENKDKILTKMSLNDLYKDYLNSNIFIGFIISFILLKGLKHSYRVFIEKEDFIYNRIFMAPVKTYEYYVADILSGVIDVTLQILLTILGINLIKVNIGVSNLNLFIILFFVGLVSLSLCICLRTFTKNRNELSNIYNFIHITLIMISGLFIPSEMLPDIVNKISYFTPTKWAGESISTIQQGGSLQDIGLNILVLSLFTLVFLLIGIYRTRNEEKSNLIL